MVKLINSHMIDSIETTEIKIPAKTQRYCINFCHNIAEAESLIAITLQNKKYIIITDENVFQKSPLFNTAKKLVNTSNTLVLKPGEASKNWDSIDRILNFAFEADLGRQDTMIAVGGGVIGDMVGFASSIYMRGIDCVQVPTSLLAMVDSSVGGKTGVDSEYGKNLIGTFKHPKSVIIAREFLNTLPEEELKNGVCEMIKHGILASLEHFSSLKTVETSNPDTFRNQLFALVPDSINIKKKIVEADEKEADIRGFLNLGHTFGHAIEHLSQYEIPHGRAVAIGCRMATEFAIKESWCKADLLEQIKNIFDHFKIDTTCQIPEDQIWEAMRYDKKKLDGKVRLILPKSIGKVGYFTVED